jgi:hypothetical protein
MNCARLQNDSPGTTTHVSAWNDWRHPAGISCATAGDAAAADDDDNGDGDAGFERSGLSSSSSSKPPDT